MRASGVLDDLARALAEPMPRRQALRVLGASLAVAAVPALRPATAGGAPRASTVTPCSNTNAWCPSGGAVCGFNVAADNTGAQTCIFGCCMGRGQGTVCCHFRPPGEIPHAWCCDAGTVCGNPLTDNALCKGCPSGRTPCRTSCCEPGKRCVNNECVDSDCDGERCAGRCCPSGQKCCPSTREMPRARCYDPTLECCTPVGGVVPKFPIQKVEWCPDRVPRRNFQPSANGCGPAGGPKVPDAPAGADFKPACDGHDICYSTCGAGKAGCDTRFYRGMTARCRQEFGVGLSRLRCFHAAAIYYTAVSKAGGDAYEAAQQAACNRCCP